MIPTYEERLGKLKQENPRNTEVEGLIGYADRLRRLAEDELLAVLRNKWHTGAEKFEATAQLFEVNRNKTSY